MTSDGTLSRAYGVPKIHKQNIPYRIIISAVNSPTYKIANYLHEILNISFDREGRNVKNSFELLQRIKNTKLDNNTTLASLDAVSLFTNIPIDKAIESIEKRWETITTHTVIPLTEFINAIKLVFETTYFMFNKKIYKQIFGTPMGSPLSPVIADMVLHDMESLAIENLTYPLPLYYRYVDDILLAAPKDSLNDLLDRFNTLHSRLKFTLEISNDNTINFLNVKITKNQNNELEFDIYHKPTCSGRYLNYHSNHPWAQKKGVIFGMVDRILLLSEPKFYEKNLKNTITTLLRNGYTLQTIFKNINNRIKQQINKKEQDHKIVEQSLEEYNYFTIPYIKNISEKFGRKFKNYFKIAYSCKNKLNRYIVTGKDKLEQMEKSGIVYQINCNNCEASYVGQTKRKLKTRIKEHINDIRKNPDSHSVISMHRINYDHNFNWEKTKILDIEQNYSKRLTSEMVYIKKQKQGINKISDIELLPECYYNLIK